MSRTITYSPPYALIDGFLRQFGKSSLAFSSLQPNLKYYVDTDIGYMAFIYLKDPVWARTGLNVVIGDPICAENQFNTLLEGFIENCGYQQTAFIHLSTQYAKQLHKRGFLVNEMGVEHVINLNSFDLTLSGAKLSHVRRWRNKAQKSRIKVVEKKYDDICPAELNALNTRWLDGKGGKELVGLNRPLRIEDKPDVRYFWAYQDSILVGFSFFDPMYSGGTVYGYLHNIARIDPSAPNGVNDIIILEAINKFKTEGIQLCSLGLSPFAELNDNSFNPNKYFNWLFNFMYKHCGFVYPFIGNYFHKEKYRADQFTVYVSLMPKNNLYRLLGVFKALNII